MLKSIKLCGNILDSFATLKFRYLGLGFLWAWIYASWFSPVLFPKSTGFTIQNDLSWLISSGVVAVMLLVMPFLIGERDISSIIWIRLLSGVGTSVGAIMMACEPLFGIESSIISYCGAVITGVTSSWLWMLWGEFTGFVEQDLAELFVPASVLVPMAVIFTSMFITGPIAGFAVCLLPLISSMLLELSLRDELVINPVNLLSEEERKGVGKEFLRVGLSSVAIYTCISFVWGLTDYRSISGWAGSLFFPYLIGAGVAIVITVIAISYTARVSLFSLYRWLVPALIASLLLLTIDGFWFKSLSIGLLTVGQFCFDVIVWIYFSRMIRRGSCRGSVAIGINRGFIQVGVFLGSIVGILFINSHKHNVADLRLLILILTFFLTTIVFLTLGKQERVERLSNAKRVIVDSTPADPIEVACNVLSERCSLTNREHEVLEFLARGRSLPYVREELNLSKNTVDTHARNLYRKLKVHSRQELLDLVEENY